MKESILKKKLLWQSPFHLSRIDRLTFSHPHTHSCWTAIVDWCRVGSQCSAGPCFAKAGTMPVPERNEYLFLQGHETLWLSFQEQFLMWLLCVCVSKCQIATNDSRLFGLWKIISRQSKFSCCSPKRKRKITAGHQAPAFDEEWKNPDISVRSSEK